jgi:hypothetical protein
MKYLFLIGRNLLRRKTRTTLTFLSIVVTFLLFGVLMMLRVAFSGNVEAAGADRLMMTNKVSLIQPLLLSYYERINSTPGVDYSTYSSWFGGIYQDPKNGVFEFAVQPDTYLRMYPEFKLPPDQLKAWLADKQGVIVGEDLAKKFNWKIGDKIPIQGTFNRPRGGDGKTWEFNLVGIYTGDEKTDKTQFPAASRLPDRKPAGRQRRRLDGLVPHQGQGSVAIRRRLARAGQAVREFRVRDEDGHGSGGRTGLRQSGRQYRRHRHAHRGRGALHHPAHSRRARCRWPSASEPTRLGR